MVSIKMRWFLFLLFFPCFGIASAQECNDPSLQIVKEVAEIIEQHYVDDSLTHERLLLGAIQGMLAQVEGIKYEQQLVSNHLLLPSQYSQVRRALDGELVGIGIQVTMDPITNVASVTGTIPNSPGNQSGIRTGDKLLALNGQRLNSSDLSNLPLKVGSPIALLLERESQLFRLHLKQERLKLPAVTAPTIDDQIAYLKIERFHQFVPPRVKQLLQKFDQENSRGLVLDLRDNPGGRFDDAIATAEFFLPTNSNIAIMKYRAKEPQTFTTSHPIVWYKPLAILTNNGTSGGAEVLASAIQSNRRGVLIGEKTYGKSSIQSIFPLSNQFALKLTTSRIFSATGASFEGKGVLPDLMIPSDPTNYQDRQLKSAIEILRYKIEQEEPTLSKPQSLIKVVDKK